MKHKFKARDQAEYLKALEDYPAGFRRRMIETFANTLCATFMLVVVGANVRLSMGREAGTRVVDLQPLTIVLTKAQVTKLEKALKEMQSE